MSRCQTLGLLLSVLFVTALIATPAYAGETAVAQALPAAEVAEVVPVTCLSLELPVATVPGEVCSAQPENEGLDFLMGGKRLGYCHCGCSSVRTCRTSADCGGASCDQFISCC